MSSDTGLSARDLPAAMKLVEGMQCECGKTYKSLLDYIQHIADVEKFRDEAENQITTACSNRDRHFAHLSRIKQSMRAELDNAHKEPSKK